MASIRSDKDGNVIADGDVLLKVGKTVKVNGVDALGGGGGGITGITPTEGGFNVTGSFFLADGENVYTGEDPLNNGVRSVRVADATARLALVGFGLGTTVYQDDTGEIYYLLNTLQVTSEAGWVKIELNTFSVLPNAVSDPIAGSAVLAYWEDPGIPELVDQFAVLQHDLVITDSGNSSANGQYRSKGISNGGASGIPAGRYHKFDAAEFSGFHTLKLENTGPYTGEWIIYGGAGEGAFYRTNNAPQDPTQGTWIGAVDDPDNVLTGIAPMPTLNWLAVSRLVSVPALSSAVIALSGVESDISNLASEIASTLPRDASTLDAADALAGTDVVTVVQGGVAKKTTLTDLKTFFNT